MKIIINQPRASYFVGGAEMISFDHAINLYNLGHDIYFFTILPSSVNIKHSPQFEKFYQKYFDKIHIIEISQDKKVEYIYEIEPGQDRCRWNIESIYYNQKLYEYIFEHQEKYDAIFSYYNLDAVFIPRKYISKNVLYLCGIPREQNDFQGSFLSAYDTVIAISEEVKESWKRYCKNEVKVISTGVDCNRFSPQNKYSSPKTINLLYVGRLIERKNIDKIIQSYEKLQSIYNVKLIIVGDGPDRKRLKTMSNKCVFTGNVQNTEHYYQQADIFISPSGYGEGLQGTILEAMSCGLTIVATNTQINSELLADGRGFVVESNVDSIVEGIKRAIDSDRTKISQKNREYVIKHYNWKNKVNEILEELK